MMPQHWSHASCCHPPHSRVCLFFLLILSKQEHVFSFIQFTSLQHHNLCLQHFFMFILHVCGCKWYGLTPYASISTTSRYMLWIWRLLKSCLHGHIFVNRNNQTDFSILISWLKIPTPHDPHYEHDRMSCKGKTQYKLSLGNIHKK